MIDTSNPSSVRSEASWRNSWLAATLLTILIALVYLAIAGQTTLWDRDEPRFCKAAWEMMQSGNYLYPTFQGKLRPDKPILIYWLMNLAVALIGAKEIAFRAFSCFAAAGSCLLTYAIGRWLLNRRTAIWAMLILASSLLLIVMGTLATVDAVLLFFLTAAMAVFLHGVSHERFSIWHGLGMTLALGLGQLTKGPVALLPTLGMMAIGIALHKVKKPLAKGWLMQTILAIVGSTIIFLAWAIPANLATQNAFAQQGLGKHVFQRMVSPQEGHGEHYWLMLPFYLGVLVVGFFPWTLHLPGGIHALLVGRLALPDDPIAQRLSPKAILLGWILPVLIVMTLVATKLPHYILPCWPALALIAAATIPAHETGQFKEWDWRWLRGGVWFFGSMSLVVAGGMIVVPWLIPAMNAVAWVWSLFGASLLIWASLLVYLQLKHRALTSAKVLIVGSLIFQPLLWTILVPSLEGFIKHSPPLAAMIARESPSIRQVALHGYDEPSIHFYLGLQHRQTVNLPSQQAIIDWAAEPGLGLLVIDRATYELLPEPSRQSLTLLGQSQGMNTNTKARQQEILLLKRSDFLRE